MDGTLQPRKHLSGDALIRLIRSSFEQIDFPRPEDASISLPDALMSGFAMFSLKDPSLLAFDKRREEAHLLRNIQRVYKVQQVPCDTQMRTIVDPVPPALLRPAFKDVFRQMQRGKALERYQILGGYYLLSLDGTGYFSSSKVHCASCMQKVSRSGKITYYHQMLAGAVVHPDFKEVIPLCPEPIVKQDGQAKNDCERNAARRFLEQLRRDHPHLPLIIVEDALSSNAPHVRDLIHYNMRFILGVKEGDHTFLFDEVEGREDAGEATHFEIKDVTTPGKRHLFTVVENVPLNESNQDVLVNFVRYIEVDEATDTRRIFTWITDLKVRRANGWQFMRAGRARWKIENETFNTLKNQGYHLEHNYGHGEQYLSVVFVFLMMLAFLVDQCQQACCKLFQAAWHKQGTKRLFWNRIRSIFYECEVDSLEHVFKALYYGYERSSPKILDSS